MFQPNQQFEWMSEAQRDAAISEATRVMVEEITDLLDAIVSGDGTPDPRPAAQRAGEYLHMLGATDHETWMFWAKRFTGYDR